MTGEMDSDDEEEFTMERDRDADDDLRQTFGKRGGENRDQSGSYEFDGNKTGKMSLQEELGALKDELQEFDPNRDQPNALAESSI